MKRSPYIVGPVYDWAFFLLPPVLGLGLGIAISGSAFSNAAMTVAGTETTGAALFMGTLIHAHLVAVFWRSHANVEIFKLHPWRFVAVPIVLWLGIYFSLWVAIVASVLATFWDVWHSGAQTFGFARIYDRNAGSPPEQGRRLDHWLNQLLYAGPILAGATLMDHVEDFGQFEDVGATFFTQIPAWVQGGRRWISWGVIAAGTAFLVYYVLSYLRLRRRGYRVSPLKLWLVVSTGACSIYTWGFNTWGEAFFIMNFFHATQYLALVWASEHPRLVKTLRIERVPGAKWGALALFLGSVAAYGLAVQLVDPDLHAFWALTIVVSLMHFWYDAFIWSVRKKQV
jgi:hypothetical protein